MRPAAHARRAGRWPRASASRPGSSWSATWSGEGAAQEQAVVGETPNLAARLQALAEPGAVVVAEATRRLLGGLFELADLGPAEVKGFAAPVRAFRVIGEGAGGGPVRGAARHRRATPLVGREQELALLLDRWRLARAGEGQVVLLSGEPGIGKSRLVLALRERLRAEDRVSLRYHCSPYHANSALHPVIEQLERAAGFARGDDDAAKLAKLEALLARAVADVAEVAPFFAELLSLPTEGRFALPPLTPQEKKARTFRALLAQLEGLAARSPVLMVLEDAHWIDPTTLELFDLAVQRLERLPVLLVVTYRPEFRPPWTATRTSRRSPSTGSAGPPRRPSWTGWRPAGGRPSRCSARSSRRPTGCRCSSRS